MNMLPPEWIALTVAKATSTEKTWGNYNLDYRRWQELQHFVQQGLISADDVPAPPNIDDYPVS